MKIMPNFYIPKNEDDAKNPKSYSFSQSYTLMLATLQINRSCKQVTFR